jgi:hypothetical protein
MPDTRRTVLLIWACFLVCGKFYFMAPLPASADR